MKLDTAIRETVLREAEVVAGEENFQRDITWVGMVDHPDIVNWVKSGELLLTTGYNWPNDAEASRRLVRDLSEVGLAGVVSRFLLSRPLSDRGYRGGTQRRLSPP